MSARKVDQSVFAGETASAKTCLTLPSHAVRIRKSGIEFRSVTPIRAWTEMTVQLEASKDAKKVRCTGIVVDCNGNPDCGYLISMLFTDMTRQSQASLNALTSHPV